MPAFGRHTLGDENLEREAFKLQPGEVSTLIGTPQGQVVIKCDRRIPPDTNVKLEQVRDEADEGDPREEGAAGDAGGLQERATRPAPQLLLRPSARRWTWRRSAKKLLEDPTPKR